MSLATTAIEPLRFREALGHYASGITVITSRIDGEPIGFTCQSFYSVSMSPPLVSFSVMSRSASYPKIRQAGRFTVNILSGEQVGISNQFARRGANKWQGVEWQASPLGNPIIAGSLHWLDCEIHAEHAAGHVDDRAARAQRPPRSDSGRVASSLSRFTTSCHQASIG